MLGTTGAGTMGYFLGPDTQREYRRLAVDLVWLAGDRIRGKYPALGDAPDAAAAEALQILARLDPRVRVACYHQCQTFDKSVDLTVVWMTPDERAAFFAHLLGTARAVHTPAMEMQVVKRGSQGAERVPSHGIGIAAPGYLGAHDQWVTQVDIYKMNWSMTADHRTGAVGNARATIYDRQGLDNALAQKAADDYLQERGVRTALAPDGVHVRVVGFPEKLLEERSPARAAIEEKLAAAGRDGPKAAEYAALTAHHAAERARKDRPDPTPDELAEAERGHCRKYGVTRETVLPARPPVFLSDDAKAEREADRARLAGFAAHARAAEARDELSRERGTFRAEDLVERTVLKCVGPQPVEIPDGRGGTKAVEVHVRLEEAVARAELFLRGPEYAGVHRVVYDQHVRYFTEASKATIRESERLHERADVRPEPGPAAGPKEEKQADPRAKKPAEPTPDARPADAPPRSRTVAEAWDNFKAAGRDLGKALLVTTADTGTEVLKALREKLKKDDPPVHQIRADEVRGFLRAHTPVPYWECHKRALRAALTTPYGDPLRVAGAAFREAFFYGYDRLKPGTTVVVSSGAALDAKEKLGLAALQERYGVRVLLADTPANLAAALKPGADRAKAQAPEPENHRPPPEPERDRGPGGR